MARLLQNYSNSKLVFLHNAPKCQLAARILPFGGIKDSFKSEFSMHRLSVYRYPGNDSFDRIT